jgi:hypothetical protein
MPPHLILHPRRRDIQRHRSDLGRPIAKDRPVLGVQSSLGWH